MWLKSCVARYSRLIYKIYGLIAYIMCGYFYTNVSMLIAVILIVQRDFRCGLVLAGDP
jgi:hypothetical protein